MRVFCIYHQKEYLALNVGNDYGTETNWCDLVDARCKEKMWRDGLERAITF